MKTMPSAGIDVKKAKSKLRGERKVMARRCVSKADADAQAIVDEFGR